MVSFDIESIKNRMINRLKTKQSWENILFYSTNLILIETFAEELKYLADFDVYLTNECKWSLARNRTSLLSSQDLHNYKAKRKISAKGSLRLSTDKNFNNAYGKDIIIPKWTVFKTADNKKYLSKNTYILNATSKYIDIDIIQGEYKILNFTSLGVANEVFNINSTNIENDNIYVKVNNIEYTQVNNIYEYGEKDKIYQIKYRIDNDSLDIIFGDDIFGRKLQAGDLVEISYIETLGEQGNITGIDIINKVVSNIKDIDNQSVKLYCSNLGAVIGGQNDESIESIRLNATNYFQTADRAVTKKDYETLIPMVATFVKKVSVWGVYETNIDNDKDMWEYIPAEENFVNICALNQNYQALTPYEQQQLSLALLEKKSTTDILRFYDPEIIELIFKVDAFVKDKSYLLNNVKNVIQNTLQNNFALSKSDFFKHIYYSDVVRLIDEVEGVDYHNTELWLQNHFTFTNEYITDISTSIYPITKNSVEVYIKNLNTNEIILIGKDNGNGNIVGENGYNLTGSNINYNNGLGVLIVLNNLTLPIDKYDIQFRYKVVNNNIILKNRKQLVSYLANTSNVSVFYT